MNLWKYIFTLTKNKEQGFTIPLILGFGLFMILIAMTAIKTGSSSETNSKLQNKSSQALAAAEVGLARLQSLMDEERQVATYPDCVGTRDSTTGVCPDTGTTASWTNASAISSSTSSTLCGNTTTTDSLAVLQTVAASSQWQDIDTTDPTRGQYRLVSYSYTGSSNKPPGVGRLIVEGRTNQGKANAVKTDEKAYNTGVARIRAEIPVNENILSTTGSVPGLWMKYNNATNMNNDKINGDILIEGCLLPGGVTTSNLYNTTTQTLSFAPDPMPDTPALPTDRRYLIGDGIASPDNTPANDPAITNPFSVGTFPRATDDMAPDGYYHYLIGNAVVNGGSDITITAGKKVIFYLQGNLDMGGSPNINNGMGSSAVNLQIYGNTTVANGTGLNGTNYKYGCFTGASSGDCPTTKIYFNGTGDVKALIHAPEATGSVKGGGNAVGQGQVKGTLWLANWLAGSADAKVKVDAEGQLTDLLSVTTKTKTVEPQITVTSSWVREGVQ